MTFSESFQMHPQLFNSPDSGQERMCIQDKTKGTRSSDVCNNTPLTLGKLRDNKLPQARHGNLKAVFVLLLLFHVSSSFV